jgi:formamidopyrimidine-DNA glycosylase
MPELPEVETVVRGLNAQVRGLTIKSVAHIAAHLKRRDSNLGSLAGDTFANFRRRGKYIIAELSSGRNLLIHLRMSGRILVTDDSIRRRKHDHFVATFAKCDRRLVFSDVRKFGVLEFLDGNRSDGYHTLGIEATHITSAKLRSLLQGSSRPVKALLLDQTALAGLGNIYADETLYRSRVHPLRPCDKVESGEVSRMAANIRTILRSAIKMMGTTFDSYSGVNGNPGEYSRFLRVYNREGTVCRRCGDTIIKIRAAGRGTHLCPTCQPLTNNRIRRR